MSTQQQQQGYAVSVHESDRTPNTFEVAFVPQGLQQGRGPNGRPARVPQFMATVRVEGDGFLIDWAESPDDPGAERPALEQQVWDRMRARSAWAARVSELVSTVEQWAKELGWATRRVEKRLDDSYIGRHKVPGLLMQ